MSNADTLLSHFYIKIDSGEAPPELLNDVLEIAVENSLHLPDVATVILHDPHLRWIDEATLAAGKELQIASGSRHGEHPLFNGEIVEIEPDFGPSTQRLIVRAFDRLHRLSRGRHVRSFLNVTDGDLVQKIAQEVGLQAHVGPTSQVHPYVFQANETNLDFLQKRAAALGYLLFVQDKTLHCVAPENKPPVKLQWGQTLSTFRPRLTTLGQASEITVRGWDPAQRQAIVGQAHKGKGSPQLQQSRDGGNAAEEAFHIQAPYLVADRPIRTQAEADQLAQAVADRQAGRFIEAEGSCGGNPAIVAGISLQISAVGDRFSGTYFVTSAVHKYNAPEGYSTEFSISGLNAATLLNLLCPYQEEWAPSGLVIGIVTDNQDPQGLGRVKVKYPWLSGEHASDWARIVTPGGGADRGIEFLPEINDEVLVGFELDDFHYPYVLGGLWNGKDSPPRKSSAAVSAGRVQQRVIRSRTGHMIMLDDADGGGGVTVTDKNGNEIKLDSGANALTITVQGNATLKAKGNLTLEAQGRVELKGTGVQVDGGAATVDVKGSMINLN